MSSVAARSLGTSPSVMRPISLYLKVPPLAHSTTSPMGCFLVVATRRAAVRKSLRSWFNPGLAADPLPLVGAGSEPDPLTGGLVGGLADPFPPETLVPFPGAGVSPGEFDGALPGVVSAGEGASVGSLPESRSVPNGGNAVAKPQASGNTSPPAPNDGNGSSGFNQLRNEFLTTARGVATTRNQTIGEVVVWASGGTFKYGDIGRMVEADIPKLRAATEFMASALAGSPR